MNFFQQKIQSASVKEFAIYRSGILFRVSSSSIEWQINTFGSYGIVSTKSLIYHSLVFNSSLGSSYGDLGLLVIVSFLFGCLFKIGSGQRTDWHITLCILSYAPCQRRKQSSMCCVVVSLLVRCNFCCKALASSNLHLPCVIIPSLSGVIVQGKGWAKIYARD